MLSLSDSLTLKILRSFLFLYMCCGEVSTAQGEEGSPMSISCPYPPEHQHNLKYLCRGKRPSTCLRQAVITSNNSSRGRFSIHDDKVAGNFTVTISRLTPNDSGSYLCGSCFTAHSNGVIFCRTESLTSAGNLSQFVKSFSLYCAVHFRTLFRPQFQFLHIRKNVIVPLTTRPRVSGLCLKFKV
uniref:Immunoglobulin V-set domain-containing protein n=1 Tax=Myripristis murdjan TaxID=586833 RepID=A0A667ZG85_9TELE